ncbi:MAG: hypothetical protein WDW38_003048 [Sanguina aurantia]
MAFDEATQLFAKFKASYSKGDLSGAESLLSQLKLKLILLPALPPCYEESPTSQQELLLARDIYEHAVLLSLKQKNDSAMERSFAQARTFYSDTRTLLPPSPEELSVQGLNLLRLLVQNRIAEFHTELELIPPEVQQTPYVKHAVQLEQWLMEGAYNKVLDASKASPSEFHTSLMQQLASTVREEIASCSEKAYERLRIQDAKRLMMLDSEKEVREYAEEHGWQIQDGYILFKAQADPNKEVPSLTLINNALVYAKELERIV